MLLNYQKLFELQPWMYYKINDNRQATNHRQFIYQLTDHQPISKNHQPPTDPPSGLPPTQRPPTKDPPTHWQVLLGPTNNQQPTTEQATCLPPTHWPSDHIRTNPETNNFKAVSILILVTFTFYVFC